MSQVSSGPNLYLPSLSLTLVVALFCAGFGQSSVPTDRPTEQSTVISGSFEHEWVMEGHNPQRNRATIGPVTPPLTLSQEYDIEEKTQFGSPVNLAGGWLLVEGEQKLHALAVESGEIAWQFNLSGSYLSPAVVDNRILVRAESGEEGYIFAITLDTGLKVWQYKFPQVGSTHNNVGGHVTSPVVAGPDGCPMVLVGAAKTFRALAVETGQVVWTFETKDPLASSAAVAEDTIYFTDFQRLYALDFEGQKRWHFDYDHVSLFFAPVVLHDRVIVTDMNRVIALNRDNGQILWTKTLVTERLVPSGAGGQIIYVKAVNQLYALAADTGDILWTYQATDFISLPALTEKHLYVITRAGGQSQLRALEIDTGQEIFSLNEAPFTNAAPIVAHGRVYLRTLDGRVLAYE